MSDVHGGQVEMQLQSEQAMEEEIGKAMLKRYSRTEVTLLSGRIATHTHWMLDHSIGDNIQLE